MPLQLRKSEMSRNAKSGDSSVSSRHKRDPEGMAGQLATLPDLPRAVLMEKWIAAYGRPPPKGLSRRLLVYAAAYHIQVQAFGGLKPAIRRELRKIAKANGSDPVPQASPARAKILSPGSRLVREWHGKTYQVEVIDGGFLCDGRRYRSLSGVARAITGARWSGPRFFGL